MTSYRLAACGYVKAVIRERAASHLESFSLMSKPLQSQTLTSGPRHSGARLPCGQKRPRSLFTASSTSLKPLTEQNGLSPKVDDEL